MGADQLASAQKDENARALVVSNLPDNVESLEDEFKSLLEPVENVKFKKQLYPGGTAVSALCQFASKDDCKRALKVLSGHEFHGHHLFVQIYSSYLAGRCVYLHSVFVSQVPQNACEEDLWKLFQSCGRIHYIEMNRKVWSETTWLTARITFPALDCVSRAINLSGSKLLGSLIVVRACCDFSISVHNIFKQSKSKFKSIEDFARSFNADGCAGPSGHKGTIIFRDQKTYDNALSALKDSPEVNSKTAALSIPKHYEIKAVRLSNISQREEELDSELNKLMEPLNIPFVVKSYEKAVYPKNTVIAAIIDFQTQIDMDKAMTFLDGREFHGEHLVVHCLSLFDYDFENSVGISKFPDDASEKDLRKLFKHCGIIRCLSVIQLNSENRVCKIAFTDANGVSQAMGLNGSLLLGTPISVVALDRKYALPCVCNELNTHFEGIRNFMKDFKAFCMIGKEQNNAFMCFPDEETYEKAVSFLRDHMLLDKSKGKQRIRFAKRPKAASKEKAKDRHKKEPSDKDINDQCTEPSEKGVSHDGNVSPKGRKRKANRTANSQADQRSSSPPPNQSKKLKNDFGAIWKRQFGEEEEEEEEEEGDRRAARGRGRGRGRGGGRGMSRGGGRGMGRGGGRGISRSRGGGRGMGRGGGRGMSRGDGRGIGRGGGRGMGRGGGRGMSRGDGRGIGRGGGRGMGRGGSRGRG